MSAFPSLLGTSGHQGMTFIKYGRLDTAAMRPIARCGYADYAVVDKVIRSCDRAARRM